MNKIDAAVTLDAEEEAARLWQGAALAFETAGDDLAPLLESLELGLRAAEIFAFQRLEPARGLFPATIGAMLESPPAELDIHRDAIEIPRTLQFTDILDLLSEESLDCVGPELHSGWEDRRFSCRRARTSARQTIGLEIDHREREALLTLSAYRNRVFRLPPPVRLDPGEIRDAFPKLIYLVERLRA